MRKMRKLLIVLMILVSYIGSINTIGAKEAFDINRHSISVVVNEDGTLNVMESLSVTFNEKRHGIYVNLPKTYEMQWEIDGQKIDKTYFFPIKDVEVLSNHDYSLEDENDFKRIIIGNEDYYAAEHETYVFKYTIVTKDLDLDGIQMLYLNLITAGWDTTTDVVDFTIAFPKDFSSENIKIAYPAGIMNSIGSQNGLTLSRQGNILSGTYNRQVKSNEAITIQVMLDKDYFSFPTLDKQAATITVISGIFALTVFVIFLWKGRDNQVLVTAQYHLPADITSAEVGLIIDEEISDNDLISLLLDWGRRGIITIEEKKDELYLQKVNDLESDCRKYERIMFDKLFESKDIVKVSSLKYKFSDTLEKSRQALRDDYQQKEKKLTTTESIVLQYVLSALSFIPATGFMGVMFYCYYYSAATVGIVIPMMMILVGLTFLADVTYRKRFIYSSKKQIIFYLIVVLSYIGLFVALYAMCVKTKVSIYYSFSIFFMQVLVLICTVCMRKRTEHGDEMLGRVLGLRHFIIDGDQQRIKNLVEENPYYFYDILPFAYAMNLTNIWNEHFKDMTLIPCEWYRSDYVYYDCYHMMHSLDSHMDTIKETMRSIDPSDSSSGSSGSFSSGGGFGGSSGGSW